jgi:hypothetical protein
VGTGGVLGCVKDSQNLSMSDLALERNKIALQVLAEGLQISQKGRPIILQLLANGLAFIGGGHTLEFEQEQALLQQVLIRDLIERQDQGFDVVGGALQVPQQGGIIAVLGDHGRRGSALGQRRGRAQQARRNADYQ